MLKPTQLSSEAEYAIGLNGGAAWIAGLGARVESILERLGLCAVHGLPGSTRGLVLLCTERKGSQVVVLKVAFDRYELAAEYQALQAWALSGESAMIRPLGFGSDGWLKLPYVGDNVDELQTEEKDTDQLVALIGSLALTPATTVSLPDLVDDVQGRLAKALARLEAMPDGPLTPRHVALARSKLVALADWPAAQLVHGDLYPGNVLVGESGLVVCDPKGLIGDPHYDAAMWAVKADAGRRFDDWVGRFATSGFERRRLEDWARVIAVHDGVAYLYNDKKRWNLPAMIELAHGLERGR
jgi:hypothetical protein